MQKEAMGATEAGLAPRTIGATGLPSGNGTAAASDSSTTVRLLLDSKSCAASCQPLTVGIPFPRGILKDAPSLQLLDDQGRPIAVQAQKLATWPDNSVKWLLVDFIAGSQVEGQTCWTLSTVYERAALPRGIQVRETDGRIEIETGAARFDLNRTTMPGLMRAVIQNKEVLDANLSDLALIDSKGRSIKPRVEKVEIECRGPVRATVCYEGIFPGRSHCRFVARFCFFAGTGLVRMRLTVHNPNRAQHRGGLWDLGDPNSMLFRDLSLQLGVTGSAEPSIVWKSERDQSEAKNLEIYQDSSGGENWQSKNHINRDGKVPCSFRGYRVRTAGQEEQGLRASPTVAISGENGTITAAITEFWQQFPKALEVQGRRLSLRLFPGQFGDLFELQGGEQKTHTIWLNFGNPSAPLAPVDWVHNPVRVHAPPQWYADCDVFPYFAPDANEERPEAILTETIAGPRNLFARREWIDEYGWRHYGEIYANHENTYYKGTPPVISHYNNQYDVVYGALFQYFRTGDVRWFDLLDPLARHVIDIDIYHTDRDRAVYNGGLFWHTDHYHDAATCTHRSYSRANCGSAGAAYGGGPGNEHNYTTGLLYYYYLTGDPQAREAVLSLADWVINLDDGTKTIFRFIDDGPAGWASFTDRFTYHGPGRGCGNSINALLDGWQLSGRRRYLEKAEELLRRVIHPNDDVPARDLLNVEERWSYTLFLLVVVRYLGLKAEADEVDFMYAYARASLLQYAEWMVENERPYFDQAEKLEFPTETWAAQELRKANVMRLSTQYADEPLRGRLVKRGEEFAERAWADLARFPSHDTARAIAILLSAGTQDSYLRQRPLPSAPRPTQAYDFGTPEAFVPQKLRVKKQLKSPGGVARALAHLLGWKGNTKKPQ